VAAAYARGLAMQGLPDLNIPLEGHGLFFCGDFSILQQYLRSENT